MTVKDLKSVLSVCERATAADAAAPLSEQFLLGLEDSRLGHSHVEHSEDGRVVAVVAVDPASHSVEMVVDPAWRRRGIGSRLLTEVLRSHPRAQLWAHGNLPAARGLAQRHGLRPARTLLVMARPVVDPPINPPHVPEGFELVSYEQATAAWGEACVNEAWLGANNEAFSWHPEQGGWSMERLRRAREVSWFDPRGLLFILPESQMSQESLIVAGFHWTKRAQPGSGEVYVVGLADDFRGKGLGAPLISAGLDYLAHSGAKTITLYVEADNAPAIKAYEKLGFAVVEEHTVYQAIED